MNAMIDRTQSHTVWLSPPQRGAVTIAQRFSAGKSCNALISPVGTAETAHFSFSRPYGTDSMSTLDPGTEVPGYCHCVPLGRDFAKTAPGSGESA